MIYLYPLIAILVGLSIGYGCKMWSYGVRNAMLIISPVMSFLLVAVLPFITAIIVIFYPNLIARLYGNAINLSKYRKLQLAVSMFVFCIQMFPLTSGITAFSIASLLRQRKLPVKSNVIVTSRLIFNGIFERRFARVHF